MPEVCSPVVGSGLQPNFKLPCSIGNAVEIISGRFYWAPLKPSCTPVQNHNHKWRLIEGGKPTLVENFHFFAIDEEYVYDPFWTDFGPLHLGHVYNYCMSLIEIFKDPKYQNMAIVHYTDSTSFTKVANSAFLVGAFLVSVLGVSARKAFEIFDSVKNGIRPYRDATFGPCQYELTLLDCFEALEFAKKLRWWDYETFDELSYRQLSECSNGDLNWIIPEKFVAFSGPVEKDLQESGYQSFTPEEYLPVLKSLEIETVIRLNKKQYDATKFSHNGLEHHDIFFPDGSCPTKEVIEKFLKIAEDPIDRKIGVHCKAGLGRTGTLIGVFAMKHYQFPARLWIGWNRICRPGSILGPQQKFLLAIESEFIVEEGNYTSKPASKINRSIVDLFKRLSIREAETAQKGEKGQGERLVEAKRPGKLTTAKVPVMALKSPSPKFQQSI
eukprot:GHVP01066657.1.p1 GENE.GHVP01066657.1~~GHVP01066657.1.p1  ORF type:complete len:441 (+),score=62.28 GHVP01066657.1:55-1377(+)